MLKVPALWISRNLSAHDLCQRVALSRGLLDLYTSDKELFLWFVLSEQKVDSSLGPRKQIRMYIEEACGLPHIHINLELSHYLIRLWRQFSRIQAICL